MAQFQQQMEQIVAALESRPRLLLHSCCGPCSSAVLERLTPHFRVTVFFYNPCIHPIGEYEKRLSEQKRLLSALPPLQRRWCRSP
jgi:predicted adenine nucleotide alpha hydrolase (AANH) superfamily ATPase